MTIFEMKEQAVTETPLLVFECTPINGQTERWSTHRVTVGGATYEPRVMQHSAFEMQTASAQGVDGIPQISIVLANADSHFSEVERATGWKGARLKVSFLFCDLRNQTAASEIALLFQGICNPPDEIRESTFRITATNRMNLQRVLLPQVRIQRRCPWEFPGTPEQRAEAVAGGADGKYSRYYRCGYSAGVDGGAGNLNGTVAYATCGYTRSECQARGMFSHFGGIGFVPPAINVRTAGDKGWHVSAVSENAARYNDFVPMVYGTAWYAPPVVFARNDGNLTRMEALLGIGEMEGVLKVLVNDVEIPVGVSGSDMTGTGWYNVQTLGTRAGRCDPNFLDGSGQPAGDPYGSMAYLTVVVPNRLNDGTKLPGIRVLAEGLKVPIYGPDGAQRGEAFSSNPAWILLDVLRRTGWRAAEIDIPSFAEAAAYCDEEINAMDLYGNAIRLPRFRCNLALRNRRSAGEIARGIRAGARLLLTYGANGLLQVRVENTMAKEQPAKPQCSNGAEPVNGGWPSYEFGDGSGGIGGILRRANGEPSVRVYSRSMADTPNRFSVEFQDELNAYQQDSFSVVDADDVQRSGQEISSALTAVGIPNCDQAGRILKLNLDKSVRGNTYIEFETSVKALGVRPGDLITVTYLKEGFIRQPFRVLKIAPGINHRITTVMAQIHDDIWYADSNGQTDSAAGGRRENGAGIGVPRPLLGDTVDENGEIQFGISETLETSSDASVAATLTVGCMPPRPAAGAGPGIPLVNLRPTVIPGGALAGGQALYYAVSGTDAAGVESASSFLVRATVAENGSAVTISGLSFAPGTVGFHVYRGSTPAQLFRIATNQPLASQFTDAGLPRQTIAPPDPNFDHANFCWRLERVPEFAATIHSSRTAGNDELQMKPDAYRGLTARITRGRGAGQERTITSNTETTLTVTPEWGVEPDATSYFVVADNGWKLGAQTTAETAQFAVPNRSGEWVHITGRSANVNNVECAPETSLVTRWRIGGGGIADTDAPPKPLFGLSPGKQGGTVELSGIGFTDLKNTHAVSSATLTMYYYDELVGAPLTALAGGLVAEDQAITLNQAGPAQAGSYIQIDSEIMRIEAVDGCAYQVTRGAHGSEAATHDALTPVYHLAAKTAVAAFPPGFFGSAYSGDWSYIVALPDTRIASAELFVTNNKGNSETNSVFLTHTAERGLRTLSGGQYAIQVDGFLAVEQSAAPALLIEASHAVRDIYAVLGRTADAPVQLQLNVDDNPYCTLEFEAGRPVSNSVEGTELPALPAGAQLTLSVLSVGRASPGADLTVLVRL